MPNVLVIGAGPAGWLAAVRAAELGAHTTLVTSGNFGGMAANDGPVPVRTLAHAARLMREARQLGQYGIVVGDPVLDYSRLLERARSIIQDVRRQSMRLEEVRQLGVIVHEHAGAAGFIDSHTLATASGLRLTADRFILCTGGMSRRLALPGSELCCTHSDAWSLTAVPRSMIVVGGGDTGLQVASIFNAFGTRVQLFQAGPRILPRADESVAVEIAGAFRKSGIEIRENFGAITSFEKTAGGVRMNFSDQGASAAAEAALVVVAVGWIANTSALNLAAAGVALNQRGFVEVDEYLQTSAPQVLAAGDATGQLMLMPQALQQGFVAASNAVHGLRSVYTSEINPVGSYTDPEYAEVGLTELEARKLHDSFSVIVPFAAVTRPIIDGRTTGFCKLVIDRASHRLLGCHIVGERAVELVQLAATAMAGGLRVEDLARMPISLPTYAGILTRAAVLAARECVPGLESLPGP